MDATPEKRTNLGLISYLLTVRHAIAVSCRVFAVHYLVKQSQVADFTSIFMGVAHLEICLIYSIRQRVVPRDAISIGDGKFETAFKQATKLLVLLEHAQIPVAFIGESAMSLFGRKFLKRVRDMMRNWF